MSLRPGIDRILASLALLALGAWLGSRQPEANVALGDQLPGAPALDVGSSLAGVVEPDVAASERGAINSVAETLAESSAEAETTLADILEEAGDFSDPAVRQRVVARMQELDATRFAETTTLARRRGLAARVERPDGTVQELAEFKDGQPLYFTTHNSNAAITTGANLLQAAPYDLSGAGVTAGVWDGGSVRVSHQEFATSRVISKDAAVSIDHATHVAGTIAAAGIVAAARGMAPAAKVDSYDWNSDKTEMTARAATATNQTTMLYLSNHSYGIVSGWNYVNSGSPARVWEWNGDGATATAAENDFGRYNTNARDSDALAFSAPYFLMFRSAGNDRIDNPSAGESVALSPGGASVVAYDPAVHPAGDAVYRGGFETIGYDAVGKNVLTVGSVGDAVGAGGLRSPGAAGVSAFSCWGPTDDGRIKPDLVANGDALYSSLNGGDTAYGTFSGTSMASPNAVGTAALLIEDYARLFPGSAMRASTLKALLIHTADDRGNPGPDYKYGWGLINGKAASDLLRDHAAFPLKTRIAESLISTTRTTVTHEFVWDGVSPIRATLVWTDPAGTATTTADLRTARLRNNLDLTLVDPAGGEHLPYVMPFVGTWTQASMDQPATNGKNTTDNVEQVDLVAPGVAGVYRCVITFVGTLTNSEQRYSLVLSGAADEAPPPPPLTVASLAPASALPGLVSLTLTGTGFKEGSTFRLTRSGQADRVATGVALSGENLIGQIDLSGAAPGTWNLIVDNPAPAAENFTLADAFTVLNVLWSETFDGQVSGWSSVASIGSNAWSLSTAQSQSPASAYFASAPATKSTTSLVSPVIPIGAGASNLQFTFWHRYTFNTGDAGKLELSVDGGATWFDVIASGSGAVFTSNGYTGTVSSTGNSQSRNEFAGQSAWTGSTSGFVQTVVSLTETSKFAGKNFRARWRLATNNTTASIGWYVDSIALNGSGDASNLAPVITAPAASAATETVTDPGGAVFGVVRGNEIGLSVAASDDGGAAGLVYTWSMTGPADTPASFSVNSSAAASATTAYFEGTGDYVFTVTVRDAAGLESSSSTSVRVVATADALGVSPAVASVAVGGALDFVATLLDQFGHALDPQPTSTEWSVSGGGVIDATGRFSANAAGGPFAVTAVVSGKSGAASVTVNRAVAAVALSQLVQTYDGSAKPVAVVTTPPGLPVVLTYDGQTAAPSAVGQYAVEAVVVSADYQGGASATLVIEARRFTLAVNADPVEGGRVEGGGIFVEGALAPLGAIPEAGWRFTGWTGAGITGPTSSATTVLVTADLTVSAGFARMNAYELWASAAGLSGAQAEPLADADGDGLANLLEYATAGDPLAAGVSPVQIGEQGGALTLTFPGIADPRLIYTVEAADALDGAWSPVAAEGNPSTGAANAAGSITIVDTVRADSRPMRFLRLRIGY